MKRLTIWFVCLMLVVPVIWAFDKAEKTETPAEPGDEAKAEINWMSVDDVQVAMKKQPKKVYMDVYTSWCSWCKVMDKKTFSNPNVIKYMNENFYAVKLNAEQKSDIRFLGKMYSYKSELGANEFAYNMLQGKLSYPTSVFMEENFQIPQPVPSYLNVEQMEMILKYFAQNLYKTTPFDVYQKDFKPTWK